METRQLQLLRAPSSSLSHQYLGATAGALDWFAPVLSLNPKKTSLSSSSFRIFCKNHNSFLHFSTKVKLNVCFIKCVAGWAPVNLKYVLLCLTENLIVLFVAPVGWKHIYSLFLESFSSVFISYASLIICRFCSSAFSKLMLEQQNLITWFLFPVNPYCQWL